MDIILYYKQLRHDIDQWTYRIGMGIKDPENRYYAQADDKPTDTTFYLRLIHNAIADLKILLKEYIDYEVTSADDKIDSEVESWSFSFKSNVAEPKALADYMHHFVVANAMSHWALIYGVPDAVTGRISKELQDAKNNLTENLYSLLLPIKARRIPLTTIYKSSIEVEK